MHSSFFLVILIVVGAQAFYYEDLPFDAPVQKIHGGFMIKNGLNGPIYPGAFKTPILKRSAWSTLSQPEVHLLVKAGISWPQLKVLNSHGLTTSQVMSLVRHGFVGHQLLSLCNTGLGYREILATAPTTSLVTLVHQRPAVAVPPLTATSVPAQPAVATITATKKKSSKKSSSSKKKTTRRISTTANN